MFTPSSSILWQRRPGALLAANVSWKQAAVGKRLPLIMTYKNRGGKCSVVAPVKYWADSHLAWLNIYDGGAMMTHEGRVDSVDIGRGVDNKL